LTGPGTGYLRAVLGRLLAGGTRHAGALLGPLGIRYVVAGEGDLPAGVRTALGSQLDLDAIPTDGLVIFRNAHALPPAAVSTDPATAQLAAGSSLDAIQRLEDPEAVAAAALPGGWDASGPDGAAVLIGSERVGGFRADGGDGSPVPVATSFGWATRTEISGGEVHVRDADQWRRTVSVWVLALLWAAALWITRKPGSSR
jgi:hypothetical protein